MDLLTSLLLPRRRRTAKSEKAITVRKRELEYKRKYLSGAMLKHHDKWRKRVYSAVKQLKGSKEYKALHALDPTECRIHEQRLRDRLQVLRSEELARLKAMSKCLPCATGRQLAFNLIDNRQ